MIFFSLLVLGYKGLFLLIFYVIKTVSGGREGIYLSPHVNCKGYIELTRAELLFTFPN